MAEEGASAPLATAMQFTLILYGVGVRCHIIIQGDFPCIVDLEKNICTVLILCIVYSERRTGKSGKWSTIIAHS